ncbi:DUF3558 family protein [Pseudonocardia sp.]|uniref:DUF3558 family protein n=1 Tax=Pseudonocardia sp. TaxID=60912 RepID=UPI0026337EDA|nr:DUF3558 family protein [Pseudonocardia sp.]
MRRALLAVALLAPTLLGSAGCTAPAAEPAAPPAPAGPQLAARPYDIPVADIDPCALLTRPQLIELQVGRAQFSPPDGRVLQSCFWSQSIDEPIENYLIGPSQGSPAGLLTFPDRNAREITIAGFPAVEAETLYSSDGEACTVLVDVAPDENLELIYSYDGTELQVTLEESCTKARRAMELAMQTLIARDGS